MSQYLRIKMFAVLLMCLVLASCGVPLQARKSAELLSTYAVQLQKDAGHYSKSRLDLAKAISRNINNLENSAVRIEQFNEETLGMWNLKYVDDKKKDTRVLLYSYVHDATQKAYKYHVESEKRISEQEKMVSKMKSADNFKLKKLHETAESLSELTKKADFKLQVKFLIAFGEEVGKSVKEVKDNAKKQTDKSVKEIESKTKEAKVIDDKVKEIQIKASRGNGG